MEITRAFLARIFPETVTYQLTRFTALRELLLTLLAVAC